MALMRPGSILDAKGLARWIPNNAMNMHYRYIHLFFVLLLGCAPQAELVKTKTDLTELRSELKSARTALQDIQKRVERLEADVKATVNVQQLMADTGARLDQIATDFQLIQGKIEENNFRISELGQKLDDKSFKIIELSSRIDELEAKIKAMSSGGEPGGTEKKPAPKALEPSEAFRQAREDYDKGSYELAIAGFQNYIKQFPDASQVDEAMYYVGESYYAQKQYDKAVESYSKLIKTYPKSGKLPAAKLKMGLCYLNEKNTPKAKEYLHKVIKDHPHSKEAAIAKKRLSKLGK